MGVDRTIKKGSTKPWTVTLSDSADAALDLSGATVRFKLRRREWDDSAFFVRHTAGTNSDYITIGTPASDGGVTVTPRAADWAEMSDTYGVYVGEFLVSDASSDVYSRDYVWNVEEALN